MEVTKLSSKGQIVLPKALREMHKVIAKKVKARRAQVR
jgi:bifunctional DNA-binding transcriptional regulator/antitoxin component of YhaV-PrlF toxin-antitoxin module